MLCQLQQIEDGRRLECTRCGRRLRRVGKLPPSAYRLTCAGNTHTPHQAGRVTPHVEPDDLPCVHRSPAATGSADCGLCGGRRRVVDLFDCGAKGGACAVSRVAAGTPDGSTSKPWCCLGCGDRQPEPGA